MTERTPVPDPAPDPQVEGFLALLAARRSPRTVEAYRRDLADFGRFRGGAPAAATRGAGQDWLPDLRPAGLAPR